jgi:hypothetical protein
MVTSILVVSQGFRQLLHGVVGIAGKMVIHERHDRDSASEHSDCSRITRDLLAPVNHGAVKRLREGVYLFPCPSSRT